MKNILKFVAVAVAAVALTQTVQAVPQIVGNIGFAGSATLNSKSITSATQVTSWGTNVVTGESGSFVGFVPIFSQVLLASPWSFNSGILNNFWKVGGFTFDLSNSSVFSLAGGFLNIVLNGSVSGNGFAATPFSGSISIQSPAQDGAFQYSESLSFNSVPDGGTTVLLLGAALSGLALAKRKLMA
jgi:hypothetical protein